MTTVSLKCRTIAPRSSTCVPLGTYRQKVTKGFHLVGATSVNNGLAPLKGVSLLSRANSCIACSQCIKTGSAPPRWETEGDARLKTSREIKSSRGESKERGYETEEERTLSVVGERLNSLKSLSCVLGTTPLVRTRRHTPEYETPTPLPVTPRMASRSANSESDDAVITPSVPPCSPAPYPTSPVKQFSLDGIKICGLAVSKSAAQPRDFVSGHVRKITYCCDKCELRMMEHETMLFERSHSCMAYQRYSPRSCSPLLESKPAAPDELYTLQSLSQFLRGKRDLRDFVRGPYMSSNRLPSNDIVVVPKEEENQAKYIIKSEDITFKDDTSQSQAEDDHIGNCYEDNEKRMKKEDEKDINIGKYSETEIELVSNKKVEEILNDENDTKQETQEFVSSGDSDSSNSANLKSVKRPRCKKNKGEVVKENMELSETLTQGDYQIRDKTDVTDNLSYSTKENTFPVNERIEHREKEVDSNDKLQFVNNYPFQDLFSAFKEKLLKLPKILNDLKLQDKVSPLQSSQSNPEEESSPTEADEDNISGFVSRRYSSRDFSSRLMEITSREKLQEILKDCEDVINDVPRSFLPDISKASRNVCFTAMVDKRYNRWKNRKRRKTKKARDPFAAPSPSESSSEESKVGIDGDVSPEIENDQKVQVKFRRRRHLPEDEDKVETERPYYLHYDASSEMTSSSDKDGRQFLPSEQNVAKIEQDILSVDSSTKKEFVIFNDKDHWYDWNEIKPFSDSKYEIIPPYFNNPLAPPLISNGVNGPYKSDKEVQNQQPQIENKILQFGKQFQAPSMNLSGKMKFTTKSETAPSKSLGPAMRIENTAGFMGNGKQTELFTRKYKQQNFAYDTTEKKEQSKDEPIQDNESAVAVTTTMQGNKGVSNKSEKFKPKKSSGLDRRKCIIAKKGSMPALKQKAPKARSQSHETVKKEMPRTLSSLAFSPAFTFSLFELPKVYKTHNEEITRRASTAFSKANVMFKSNH